MDVKLTNKDITNNFSNIIQAQDGYTPPYPKIGYNAGVYGWNWSAYQVDRDTVYIQGYRSFPKYTHRSKAGMERKADEKEREIRHKAWVEYEEKRKSDPANDKKYYEQYKKKTNNLREKLWNKYVIDETLHPKENKPKAVKMKEPKMTNARLSKMSRGI